MGPWNSPKETQKIHVVRQQNLGAETQGVGPRRIAEVWFGGQEWMFFMVFSWQSKVPPPSYPPPRNKALRRPY